MVPEVDGEGVTHEGPGRVDRVSQVVGWNGWTGHIAKYARMMRKSVVASG